MRRRKERWTRTHFHVVRTEDEPPAECKSSVNQDGTEQKSKNIGWGSLECENENVVRPEETQVPQYAEPDEEISNTQTRTADIPGVWLKFLCEWIIISNNV